MSDIWAKVLTAAREQLSTNVFDTWIAPIRPAPQTDANSLVLLTNNQFTTDFVQSRYGNLLRQIAAETTGSELRLVFQTSKTTVEKPEITEPELEPIELDDTPLPPAASPTETGLNERYTFETFVVGDCNQFVYAAARGVAESLAASYNPLFIYGGTGLGKTHLMQAIGHHVRRANPEMRVLYTTSERFMTQLINALRFKRVFEFKELFRSVDLLMVDDIQFLAGKERTQEEFFHTFNALFEANKQIIITSDRFPNDIDQLEERLRSRFGWGLVADIQPPDLETRIAILKKKAVMESIPLPDDVAFFLASSIKTNVRVLEGALARVTLYSSLTNQPLTVPMAAQTLRDLVKGQTRQVSVEEIQKIVSKYYKIRPLDMVSSKRSQLFSHPRQVAMYLTKQLTNLSYPQIAHQFGRSDHTTVLYAVRRVEAKMREDKNLTEEVESLNAMLQG